VGFSSSFGSALGSAAGQVMTAELTTSSASPSAELAAAKLAEQRAGWAPIVGFSLGLGFGLIYFARSRPTQPT